MNNNPPISKQNDEISTHPRIEIVTDRFGQEYLFELFYDEEDGLSIYLYHMNQNIGHIFCNFENDEMEITDVIILNNVAHRQRGYLYSLLKCLGWKPKITNYRNRGLGSILIDYAINRAKQRGTKKIYGIVQPESQEEMPGLLQWYQKKGFNIYRYKDKNTKFPGYHFRMDLE